MKLPQIPKASKHKPYAIGKPVKTPVYDPNTQSVNAIAQAAVQSGKQILLKEIFEPVGGKHFVDQALTRDVYVHKVLICPYIGTNYLFQLWTYNAAGSAQDYYIQQYLKDNKEPYSIDFNPPLFVTSLNGTLTLRASVSPAMAGTDAFWVLVVGFDSPQ